MGKIFYLMGKSSTGKDTLFRELKKQFPALKTVVLYTTRPIREGERNGREYFFVSEKYLKQLQDLNKVIELRSYQTMYGVWRYFTVADEQINLTENSYLMIGTLESYESIKKYFGNDSIVPIYIEVEDGERLSRALEREKRQMVPRYGELCRRFLADDIDFSEENLEQAKIEVRFANDDMKSCVNEIMLYINENL